MHDSGIGAYTGAIGPAWTYPLAFSQWITILLYHYSAQRYHSTWPRDGQFPMIQLSHSSTSPVLRNPWNGAAWACDMHSATGLLKPEYLSKSKSPCPWLSWMVAIAHVVHRVAKWGQLAVHRLADVRREAAKQRLVHGETRQSILNTLHIILVLSLLEN